MSLLLFILVCYGISNIIVYGSIFEKLRNKIIANSKFFGDLIQCMMCTPFWVGLFLSLVYYSPTQTEIPYVNHFLNACLGSATSWLIHTIQEYFERSNKS